MSRPDEGRREGVRPATSEPADERGGTLRHRSRAKVPAVLATRSASVATSAQSVRRRGGAVAFGLPETHAKGRRSPVSTTTVSTGPVVIVRYSRLALTQPWPARRSSPNL
jgi:hypothetical protein